MQSELFEFKDNNIPLSEVLRPDTLDGFVGQKDLIGEGTLLRKMVDSDDYSSFILCDHLARAKLQLPTSYQKHKQFMAKFFGRYLWYKRDKRDHGRCQIKSKN